MKNKWLTILLSVGISLCGVTAQANIDLKSWKSYGNLAEQGAICASFASLMESQSVLNPDMGRLWQERRKFSGAVIGKAVMLEFDKDIASEDIEIFIAEYRDWVLAALMTSQETQTDNPAQDRLELGQEKIASLIKTQCALLFKQGDSQIREKFPELAYLIASEPADVIDNTKPDDRAEMATFAGPRITPPSPTTNAPAPTATKTTDKAAKNVPSARPESEKEPTKLAKTDLQQDENVKAEAQKTEKNAPITLALGGGISFSLTMPRSSVSASTPQPDEISDIAPEIAPVNKTPANKASAKTPVKQKPVQENTPPPAPPVLTLAQQQATPLILPVRLSLPELQDNDTKIAKIYASFGDFTDIAQAERRKALLERRFAKLFSAYQLQITAHDLPDLAPAEGQTDSPERQLAAPAYRLQTKAVLELTRAQEICTLLWPHNIGCIVKARYNS